MIKFREQVPSIYANASRDFQYMSWLIDIVLNSVKHNVDDLYDIPNTFSDARVAELFAMTLGFKVKRNYDHKQLAALIAVFPRIIKCKGTPNAINIAGKALVAASGASGDVDCKVENGELIVTLPKNLIDISLFTDLLPYIVPAGLACHIVRADRRDRNYTTELGYNDTLLAELIPNLSLDTTAQLSTGLASMFDVTATEPIFSNYKDSNVKTPNVGLLDNSIIPMVESPLNYSTSQPYSTILNEYGTTVVIDEYYVETDGDMMTVIIK